MRFTFNGQATLEATLELDPEEFLGADGPGDIMSTLADLLAADRDEDGMEVDWNEDDIADAADAIWDELGKRD